jgi:hypothetical protein
MGGVSVALWRLKKWLNIKNLPNKVLNSIDVLMQ